MVGHVPPDLASFGKMAPGPRTAMGMATATIDDLALDRAGMVRIDGDRVTVLLDRTALASSATMVLDRRTATATTADPALEPVGMARIVEGRGMVLLDRTALGCIARTGRDPRTRMTADPALAPTARAARTVGDAPALVRARNRPNVA
jgi:hypothetical protein